MAGSVFIDTEVKGKLKVFTNSVLYFFDIAFPLEFRYGKKPLRNRWITQGIKVSSKKMRFLTLQQWRTFKFLPSPRTEKFNFPTSSAPLSIRGIDL
jgi:hypothetical protein